MKPLKKDAFHIKGREENEHPYGPKMGTLGALIKKDNPFPQKIKKAFLKPLERRNGLKKSKREELRTKNIMNKKRGGLKKIGRRIILT